MKRVLLLFCSGIAYPRDAGTRWSEDTLHINNVIRKALKESNSDSRIVLFDYVLQLSEDIV